MQLFRGALFVNLVVASLGSLIRRRPDNVAPGVLDLIDQMDRDLVRINSKLGRVRSFLQVADEQKPVSVQEAAVQMESLSKMGQAGMPAMLGLLTEMYGSWKGKIGTANKREKEEKKDFDLKIRDLEMKKNTNKNDANWTKTYDKIEKYWKLQRTIAHRQYHTVLKLAHSGMERFKTVMHAMQAAVDKKKPDSTTMRKMQAMEEPEVVLLQEVESLRHWAHDSRSLLRDAKNL